MSPNRWKPPLLACATVMALFGCATQPRTASVSIAIAPPPHDPWARWAGYSRMLDQRLQPQRAFEIAMPDLPPTDRLASGQPVSDKPVGEAVAGQEVFDQQILAAHNRERQGLGLVPLRWNPALAQSAQRWADYLATTGRFEHSPENRATPEGENLWAGSKGYFTPQAMVDAWIREKRYFRPGTFPDNSVTGRVEDVGHYTQVVWRATTQLGCAEARSRNEDILVCHYAEAGNYRGEVPF